MALGDSTDPFKIKQGDTLPKLRATVTQGTPASPVDLTGATVVFNMRASTGGQAVKVNRGSATIVTPASGVVEYTFTAGNTDTPATYQGEFEATLADGGILTFPSGADYIYVQVGDDVA